MKSGLNKKEYLKDLRNILVFRSLSNGDLKKLLPFIEIIQFSADETIISEGDLSPSFFGVLRGTVVVRVDQQDKEVYLCSIGAGDIFGEAAMFLKMKRTATVVSADDTVVFKMIRHDMLKFFDEHPKEGNSILMIMVYSLLKKLRESNQELAFERRSDVAQSDVDDLLMELAGKSN
ncbi:MAG: cyclic nucleotide-binding domain-containing protein [Spirochaetaceae bacterium]|jgi:CRP-like cAMP-binding protein|nr:cyclic nucleotide-binding domain-containing protein [Spirochaetaceae bacterium]